MTQLEIVLNGIEDVINSGIQCPLENVEPRRCFHFPESLIDEIVSLLKTQMARLLTIEEITGDGECWFEGINGACGYADCYMCTGNKEVEVNRISMKPEYVSWDDYMKKWRCWTARPTDEQRKATPWDR